MAADKWRERLQQIQVVVNFDPVPLPTEAALDAYEQDTGTRLPQSFREFLLKFGPGELADEYQIVSPGYEDYSDAVDLATLNRRFQGYTSMTQRTDESLAEEFGDAARARRLVLFASTFGGDRYGWDPDDVRDPAEPEYGIYLVPHPGPIKEVATSFVEWVISLRSSQFIPALELWRSQQEAAVELEPEAERYDREEPEYQEILAFARDGAFAKTEFPDEESFVIYVLETREWNPEDEWVIQFEAWKEARTGEA